MSESVTLPRRDGLHLADLGRVGATDDQGRLYSGAAVLRPYMIATRELLVTEGFDGLDLGGGAGGEEAGGEGGDG